jgi:hypothetical protein
VVSRSFLIGNTPHHAAVDLDLLTIPDERLKIRLGQRPTGSLIIYFGKLKEQV